MAQASDDRMAALRAAYEATVPGIIGNRFIPHFPHPKQAVLLCAHKHCAPDEVFKCLFGGAAGGGKSDALLMAAAQFVEFGHYRAVIIRRTLAEMQKAGAILERAIAWWRDIPGVSYDATKLVFRFPSGATIEFGYHDHPKHNAKYQGGEYHFVGFDELTHWDDEKAWKWLGSRIRKLATDSIPLRQIGTSNPGGPGHSWVKRMFVGGQDPITGAPLTPEHLYIPSRISDNPSLDQASYIRTLEAMHPTQRDQLLEGDWGARDPGDYFRSEWFGAPLDPHEQPEPTGCTAVRWWDLAASEKEDAAYTAGVRMIRLPGGARAVTDAVKFRKTPGARDARIVQQARLDGFATVVGIEIEGGSGGVAQFDALRDRLRKEGFRVSGARPGAPLPGREAERVIRAGVSDSSKEKRADPVAACLERGFQRRGESTETQAPGWGEDQGLDYTQQRDGLLLYGGNWTSPYLDELEGFPDVTYKDLVDATSGAWAYLEAKSASAQPRSGDRTRRLAGDMLDVHPDDRPQPNSSHRRWDP